MNLSSNDPLAMTGSEPEDPRQTFTPDDAVTMAIGRLVRAWGALEKTTMDKLALLRAAAGDMRNMGGRSRPDLGMLLAEMRALVSIRDRHDRDSLIKISEIETSIQRATQFQALVIDGFQDADTDVLLCRDARNAERRVPLIDVRHAIATLEAIRSRLCAI